MSKLSKSSSGDPFYQEISELLTTARANVRSTVNTAMVQTYWHIGRLIVEEEQRGKDRADYGKTLLKELSERLTIDFGKGFNATNLRHFRNFYLCFSNQHSVSANSTRHLPNSDSQIQHSLSAESKKEHNQLTGNDLQIRHSLTGEFKSPSLSPHLSWTHYRHLLKVSDEKARLWYMDQAAKENWSTRALERQINSLYYERLLSSQEKEPLIAEAAEKTAPLRPQDILKDPYVLEFLQLAERPGYTEDDLESALIDQLQHFLLELGQGFSFVSRQKRITLDGEHFFIDLVFYNYLLKCFVVIDLKLGKLTHQDVGQLDSYVRIFEETQRAKDDNPTIGLILCSEKNEAIARYSVLADHQQLFASKYQMHLPSEAALARELEKELKELEGRLG